MQKTNSPAHIHIISRRHRLADPGGISDKWLVDAIVKAGILEDDSLKYVKAITESQEKVDKSEPEVTVVEICSAKPTIAKWKKKPV